MKCTNVNAGFLLFIIDSSLSLTSGSVGPVAVIVHSHNLVLLYNVWDSFDAFSPDPIIKQSDPFSVIAAVNPRLWAKLMKNAGLSLLSLLAITLALAWASARKFSMSQTEACSPQHLFHA